MPRMLWTYECREIGCYCKVASPIKSHVQKMVKFHTKTVGHKQTGEVQLRDMDWVTSC